MRIIEGNAVREVNLRNTAVALGTFDAMHSGHRAVIRAATECAVKNNLLSVVYLFRVSPRAAFGGEGKSVNSVEKRLEILEELGVRIAVIEDFNLEYAQTSCRDFVLFLKECLGAKTVYAGFNYHFGRQGKGDAVELQRLCREYELICDILPCVSEQGVISSSRIRDLIESGQVEEAEHFLCRPFSIAGKVIYGNQFGRTIGFPTANMELPENLVIPADGVYSSSVCLEGHTYPAITNIGGKPTVAQNERNIETHIIGFSGDLYGKNIEVKFCRRLRGIVKFSSAQELRCQLETDKQAAMSEMKRK